MAYSATGDLLERLSQQGSAHFLDRDGDGVLNAAELKIVTDSITLADGMIDGILAAGGRKVLTPGPVIKRISVSFALLDACRRMGQDAAWLVADAKDMYALLAKVAGGDLRPGVPGGAAEVVPATSTNPGPVVSNPQVVPGVGITWPRSEKTQP